jgi:hypothetical protein
LQHFTYVLFYLLSKYCSMDPLISRSRKQKSEGYRRVTWVNALWDVIVEDLQGAYGCALNAAHGDRDAAGKGAREGTQPTCLIQVGPRHTAQKCVTSSLAKNLNLGGTEPNESRHDFESSNDETRTRRRVCPLTNGLLDQETILSTTSTVSCSPKGDGAVMEGLRVTARSSAGSQHTRNV